MKPIDTALILLASGRSERFGSENKLLAQLKGKPLVRHAIDAVSSVPFAARYAVTPDNADLMDVITGAKFECIINPAPETGQGRSLSLGAKAVLASDHDAACVILADMPFISAGHIESLLLLLRGEVAVMSEYNDVAMPPCAFTRSALQSLSTMEGETGGKTLFQQNTAIHPLSEESAIDIDTKADLAAAQRLV